MRTADLLVPTAREAGFELVSLLDLPAVEDVEEAIIGARVRAEFTSSRSGTRYVAVVSETERGVVYGPKGEEGEALRRALVRVIDSVTGDSVDGIAHVDRSEHETLSNADYAPLVAARAALPFPVVAAATEAVSSSVGLGHFAPSTYLVAAHALLLGGNPDEELLSRSLALLVDLASGAPVEWALRRVEAGAPS